MLLRFPSVGRRGVRRIGLDRWRADGNDPQFLFSPALLPFSFLVLEIEETDRPIDPRVYIDQGAGFDPREEIKLRQTRSGLYVVALNSFGRVRRVRFDPTSYPSRFRFRAFAGFEESSVRAFIGRRLREAGKNARQIPTCETIAKGDVAAFAGLGARARKIRTVTQHFEQVIAMAAVHYSTADRGQGSAPLISFVAPAFDTPASYLDQLLESFRIQTEGAWELILCDDGSTSKESIDWLDKHHDVPSLRIVRNRVNGGIAAATNSGFSIARGEWIGLIDHDDALAPFAIARLAEAIGQNPNARFIYTDEVVVDAKLEPQAYFLKPAFDPALLSGVNYVNHLSLYRRDRLAEIGGLRRGFEGSQDYDLLLRYLDGLEPEQILHLPYPAYLWRRDGASYSATFLDRATHNARRALTERYSHSSVLVDVEPALDSNLHRLRFDRSIEAWPKVSVVIPNRDAFPLVSRLFEDLTRRTDYPDIEIIVADNGSKDRRVLDLYGIMLASYRAFRVEIVEEPFNFSRQVNRGVRLASGEHVLLLNNDVEVASADWLKEMVSCLAYPETGVVGARLLYPDGTLQHAGVIVGLGSVAGHWFCGEAGAHPGPMGRLNVRQSLSAVTGACMLISRRCLETVGPFDEKNFAIAYNDVDFCLRAGKKGFRVLWTPFATLYHHESASRGSDETDANVARFRREQEALRTKYALWDYVDPAFNPWYSPDYGTPRLAVPTCLPPPRVFRV